MLMQLNIATLLNYHLKHCTLECFTVTELPQYSSYEGCACYFLLRL